MRIAAITFLALFMLSGCMSIHANVPDDMVRHIAREDGVDIGATCSHGGESFSEGAISCMAGQRMSCDPTGRWVQDGSC
jgi:hypothetical protein